MLTRRNVYLEVTDEPVPAATSQLEALGYAVVEGAFAPDEVAVLHRAVTEVFDALPADERNRNLSADELDDFRYEMFNRSAEVQALVADPRLLDVLEPLLGEDCHVIANTAWRNPPNRPSAQGGGNWHMDAGPHVPRPDDVPWDDRIPYPVFAVGVHVLLEDCPLASGPTAVIPRSHRSGQAPPFDRLTDPSLTLDGEGMLALPGKAGDVVFFVSDIWHRRAPTSDGDIGRFFVQVHYGRRDIAQRVRPTREVNHLSDDALARATAGTSRDRSVVGLHARRFYDG